MTGLTIHKVTDVTISDVEGSNGTHWRTIEIETQKGEKFEVVLFLPDDNKELDITI